MPVRIDGTGPTADRGVTHAGPATSMLDSAAAGSGFSCRFDLVLLPLAALLIMVLGLVIWTLPKLVPTPVREGLRNRCPATHSPGPSGKSSAQGPGATAGDDRTKTASAAERPKGGRILVRSGGDGAGGPYAELPDGPGDQQAQPAEGDLDDGAAGATRSVARRVFLIRPTGRGATTSAAPHRDREP